MFLFPLCNFIAYQSDSVHKYMQWSKQKPHKDGSWEGKGKEVSASSTLGEQLQVRLMDIGRLL